MGITRKLKYPLPGDVYAEYAAAIRYEQLHPAKLHILKAL